MCLLLHLELNQKARKLKFWERSAHISEVLWWGYCLCYVFVLSRASLFFEDGRPVWQGLILPFILPPPWHEWSWRGGDGEHSWGQNTSRFHLLLMSQIFLECKLRAKGVSVEARSWSESHGQIFVTFSVAHGRSWSILSQTWWDKYNPSLVLWLGLFWGGFRCFCSGQYLALWEIDSHPFK